MDQSRVHTQSSKDPWLHPFLMFVISFGLHLAEPRGNQMALNNMHTHKQEEERGRNGEGKVGEVPPDIPQ